MTLPHAPRDGTALARRCGLPARPAALRLPASLDSDMDERYGRGRGMLECSLARIQSLPGVAEEHAPYLPAPRPLDRVRIAIRTRHLSPRTEEAHVFWIRRFILFHHKRHPAQMAESEVTAFLSSLAVEGRVAASTQNQALCALLFLYRQVLGTELPWLDDLVCQAHSRPAFGYFWVFP